MILISHKCSMVVVKILSTLINSPKFQFVKSQKLSDLYCKFTKNRSIKVPLNKDFSKCLINVPPKFRVIRYIKHNNVNEKHV